MSFDLILIQWNFIVNQPFIRIFILQNGIRNFIFLNVK